MIVIFMASMVGIMLEVAEPCFVLFLSIGIGTLTNVVEIKQCLTGFSHPVPWLIFFALSLSSVITQTSLGLRIAYFFVKTYGGSITGIAYSLIMTEFVVAPIIPSNTARGANIGLPIVQSISQYVSAQSDKAQGASIGAYLSILYAYSNAICSAIFITAMISNSIILEEIAKIGINLGWLSWFRVMIIPGLCILLALPFILKALYRPNVPDLAHIKIQAAKNFAALGEITSQEKFIISVFAIMLLLWVLSEAIGIPIIVTVILGICIFLMSGVSRIKDMFSSYSTLNPVIMLGILISYVNYLISLGAIDWFNSIISANLSTFGKDTAFLLLSTIYFLTHYFFSGEGSRIIALYTPFLMTGIAIGITPAKIAFTLAFFSSCSDVLAHYTCPASITIFSLGYVSAGRWMKTGLVIASFVMIVWFSYVSIVLNSDNHLCGYRIARV
jgi:DASS family divalent anion:Na+ symporter